MKQLVLLFVFFLVGTSTLHAQREIFSFTKTNKAAFHPRDVTAKVDFGNLEIWYEIEKGYNQNNMEFKLRIKNNGSTDFKGAIRMSRSNPESTFRAISIKSGETFRDSQHAPVGTNEFYLLIQKR